MIPLMPRTARVATAKIVICLTALATAFTFFPLLCKAHGEGSKTGVLIVAQGVKDPKWCRPVWDLVAELQRQLPCPVHLSFLEETEPTIPQGVENLNRAGVDRIIAVPFFISSYSNHAGKSNYWQVGLKRPPLADDFLVRVHDHLGREVSVRLIPSVFPREFFVLREKVKTGVATEEDVSDFKNLRDATLLRILSDPGALVISSSFPDTIGDGAKKAA